MGCLVGKNGVRPDPEKIKVVAEWPAPKDVKGLRKWLGMANYLHKYAANYAQLAKPLTDLLRKEVAWEWSSIQQSAFDAIKKSLISAPILALPDHTKSFSVVCDASDFAIGCALLQKDHEGRDRVISYQSRQLKAAELNYPVHDKELLAIKYALMKYRVHLLGGKPFVVYTDHASLRTATKSPHLSQRMARWLAYFSEYNFTVEYKPGKNNVLADALSRRPDWDPGGSKPNTWDPGGSGSDSVESRPTLEAAVAQCRSRMIPDDHYDVNRVTVSVVRPALTSAIQDKYADDPQCLEIINYLTGSSKDLSKSLRSKIARFSYSDGLLWHRIADADYARVVVPNDTDLREQILHEHHDVMHAGHLGREKTYVSIASHFWWPHLYKWVANYVRSCERGQRVKGSRSTQAPLHPLPIPPDCWESVSMDFIFGYPADNRGNTGILVFVDRLSKMVHLAPVKQTVTGRQCAALFIEHVFRLHGMPSSIVSDRDPRFTGAFWRELFRIHGTINNACHASHSETPFYINGLRNPMVPSTLLRSHSSGSSTLSGGGSQLDPIEIESNDQSQNSRSSLAFKSVEAGSVDADAASFHDSSSESQPMRASRAQRFSCEPESALPAPKIDRSSMQTGMAGET